MWQFKELLFPITIIRTPNIFNLYLSIDQHLTRFNFPPICVPILIVQSMIEDIHRSCIITCINYVTGGKLHLHQSCKSCIQRWNEDISSMLRKPAFTIHFLVHSSVCKSMTWKCNAIPKLCYKLIKFEYAICYAKPSTSNTYAFTPYTQCYLYEAKYW